MSSPENDTKNNSESKNDSEFESVLNKIMSARQDIPKEELLVEIERKREHMGKQFLTELGALYLIMNDLGIEPESNLVVDMKLKDLIAGSKQVTCVARVFSISPIHKFKRKDKDEESCIRSITVYDEDKKMHVKLWGEKATLPAFTTIKPGSLIRLMKVSVKKDLSGALEMHAGSGADIEVIEVEPETVNIPKIESLVKDVSTLNHQEAQNDISVSGTLVGDIKITEFTRENIKRQVVNIVIAGADNSQVRASLWDKKEENLPKYLVEGSKITLVGVRAKPGMNGIELNGDDGTLVITPECNVKEVELYILAKNDENNTVVTCNKNKEICIVKDPTSQLKSNNVADVISFTPARIYGKLLVVDQDTKINLVKSLKIEELSTLRTKINEIKPNELCFIEGIVLKGPDVREIDTQKGPVKLGEMLLEDETSQVWLKVWRDQIRSIDALTPGDIISIFGVLVKSGYENRNELAFTQYTMIRKKSMQQESISAFQ